jgi:hypothetical protein
MTHFPRSPRVMKGAIVGLDPFNPLASIIVFQYNPDTLTRRVTAQAAGSGQPARGEALRLKGPPQETIDLTVVLDAVDQLERADPIATVTGLHPTIAALEMLLYPKSALMIANEVLAEAGVIEVIPAEAPLTLFAWGIKRIVPVRITEIGITEEAFDPDLNPILARAQMSLKVLTYQDLGLLSVGGALSMAHQIVKEVLATIHGAEAIAGTASASFSASISV